MAGALNHWTRPRDELTRLLEARYRWALRWVSGPVVDCGCGYGKGTAMLTRGPRVTGVLGVDVDPEAVEVARERVPLAIIGEMDLEGPQPPPRGRWLVCLEVLEHLVDPLAVLVQMQGAAICGLVVSYPLDPSVGKGNPDHKHDLTDREVAGCFSRDWCQLSTGLLKERAADGRVLMRYRLACWVRKGVRDHVLLEEAAQADGNHDDGGE